MPILLVPEIEVSIKLDSLLSQKELQEYNNQYIYGKIVRPLLRRHLKEVKVECEAKWDSKRNCWKGHLNYEGNELYWKII
jgi:hypothetical protein